MLESIMHLPICTDYVSWIVQEQLDLKKEKIEKKAKNAKERKRKRKCEPNKRRLKYNSIFYM